MSIQVCAECGEIFAMFAGAVHCVPGTAGLAKIRHLRHLLARWKDVAAEYKRRCACLDNMIENVPIEYSQAIRERDALRRRVAELEAREQPDCCDDPASRLRPGLRVRATSVPMGRMERG